MTRTLRTMVGVAAIAAFAAFAAPVSADPPGNNGTVKIHVGPPGDGHAIEPNNPHVCTFHIHAWNFDKNQLLRWSIVGHGGPTAGPTKDSGEFRTSILGRHGWENSSEHITWFEDGHYKLTVDTGNGTPTQDKHKVFWVECDSSAGGGNGGNDGGNGGNDGGNGGNDGGEAGNDGGVSAGGRTNAGGAVAGRGNVLGGQGGPGADALPDTAVPVDLLTSFGSLLVAAAGVGLSAGRRMR